MIVTGDPFIDLIIYLLLTAGVLFALNYALTEAQVGIGGRRIACLVAGIVLIVIAFKLSGIIPLLGGT